MQQLCLDDVPLLRPIASSAAHRPSARAGWRYRGRQDGPLVAPVLRNGSSRVRLTLPPRRRQTSGAFLHDRPQRRAVHPLSPGRLSSAPVPLAVAHRRRGGVARPRHGVERRGGRSYRSCDARGRPQHRRDDRLSGRDRERGSGTSIPLSQARRCVLGREEGDGVSPLPNIREACLLWQVDADELWTAEQIVSIQELFRDDPERTAAYYWCDYVPAPGAVVATRYNYAANPAVEWLRTWRYRPGDRWEAHEPPTLVRPEAGGVFEVAKKHPFLHDETERAGVVFQHFAYATEAQVRFKESYYGYSGAVETLACAPRCGCSSRWSVTARRLSSVGAGRHARRQRRTPTRSAPRARARRRHLDVHGRCGR